MDPAFQGNQEKFDKFILVAKDQQSATLQENMLLTSFQRLEVPIEQSKLEGHAKCLTFYEIAVDT